MEDFSYALVQVVHNFGAVAVVGGAAFALFSGTATVTLHRKLAWLVGLGWAAQAMSGMGFAAVSYFYYNNLPDIHGIAMVALLIKMLCAAFGMTIAIIYLRYSATLTVERRYLAWQLLTALGLTALTAAAFLRWFS